MQKSRIEVLIRKYLHHRLDERELEELKQWIEEDASHRETFVKLLSLHHVNNQLNLLHRIDKETAWKTILKRCHPDRTARRIKIYSSAAALAVIIGISSLLYFGSRTASDQLFTSAHPDRTKVPETDGKPRATWVLADRSEVQLYSNGHEINGSHISDGQIIFPREDTKPTDSVSIDTRVVQNQIKVPRGSEYSIVLSDGTKVMLNADSHLDFPVQFSETREVTLEGEALFEVVPDEKRPFIVRTGNHAIYVLGTTFNVTAYPDEEILITLVNGKIKITAPTGEYILAPHEQYSSRTASVRKTDPELFTSWTTGAMEFDAMPLPALLVKLSRYYNVDLRLDSKELENLKFTGIIFRNQPLSFALDILHRVSDVKFEKHGETILVKKQ